LIFSEHVGHENIVEKEINKSDVDIWNQDMGWLHEADVVVAECTTTSLGVGYELGISEALKLPVLVLHRLPEKKLSAMILGNKHFKTVNYTLIEEAKQTIKDFLNQHLK
jgi:nucleoside 2-deoxyribosyltransferase